MFCDEMLAGMHLCLLSQWFWRPPAILLSFSSVGIRVWQWRVLVCGGMQMEMLLPLYVVACQSTTWLVWAHCILGSRKASYVGVLASSFLTSRTAYLAWPMDSWWYADKSSWWIWFFLHQASNSRRNCGLGSWACNYPGIKKSPGPNFRKILGIKDWIYPGIFTPLLSRQWKKGKQIPSNS